MDLSPVPPGRPPRGCGRGSSTASRDPARPGGTSLSGTASLPLLSQHRDQVGVRQFSHPRHPLPFGPPGAASVAFPRPRMTLITSDFTPISGYGGFAPVPGDDTTSVIDA